MLFIVPTFLWPVWLNLFINDHDLVTSQIEHKIDLETYMKERIFFVFTSYYCAKKKFRKTGNFQCKMCFLHKKSALWENHKIEK